MGDQATTLSSYNPLTCDSGLESIKTNVVDKAIMKFNRDILLEEYISKTKEEIEAALKGADPNISEEDILRAKIDFERKVKNKSEIDNISKDVGDFLNNNKKSIMKFVFYAFLVILSINIASALISKNSSAHALLIDKDTTEIVSLGIVPDVIPISESNTDTSDEFKKINSLYAWSVYYKPSQNPGIKNDEKFIVAINKYIDSYAFTDLTGTIIEFFDNFGSCIYDSYYSSEKFNYYYNKIFSSDLKNIKYNYRDKSDYVVDELNEFASWFKLIKAKNLSFNESNSSDFSTFLGNVKANKDDGFFNKNVYDILSKNFSF